MRSAPNSSSHLFSSHLMDCRLNLDIPKSHSVRASLVCKIRAASWDEVAVQGRTSSSRRQIFESSARENCTKILYGFQSRRAAECRPPRMRPFAFPISLPRSTDNLHVCAGTSAPRPVKARVTRRRDGLPAL